MEDEKLKVEKLLIQYQGYCNCQIRAPRVSQSPSIYRSIAIQFQFVRAIKFVKDQV